MTDIAIQAENISKEYRIGGIQAPYRTLRDSITDIFMSPFRRAARLLRGEAYGAAELDETIWALKDISFNVGYGDVVGIIGRNGAGKSTLLKIFSRITEPSEGWVRIRGRVGSLLEVGTGFHPELTGRENVFLNGAILGMSKAEIKRKFDEIVGFAEVEKFIDTPVKHYSSGMQVRLAFAVAAHLEPEILIVDEVLAVGDISFQRKCMGKMHDVSDEGRTVLFVSHNMGAITQLCKSCVWLEGGQVRDIGDTQHIVTEYLKSSYVADEQAEVVFPINEKKRAQILRVRLKNKDGIVVKTFDCDHPITISFDIQVNQVIPGLYSHMNISTVDGLVLMISYSYDNDPNPLDGLQPGRYEVQAIIPPRLFGHGDYRIYLSIAQPYASEPTLDAPQTFITFSLDDVTSKKGNERPGHLSTLLVYDVEST